MEYLTAEMGVGALHSDFQEMYTLFNREDKVNLLMDGRWGLEKEAQRVTIDGDLALTEHPAVFGGKSENPHITTDFSESQIEMITPPFPSIEATYSFLEETQKNVLAQLGNELLWPLSMPPRLPEEENIPIAKLGDTPDGRRNEIYRRGLALRYGKKMQMISGLHYNFSFGDDMLQYLYEVHGHGETKKAFTNDLYAAIARNFLRYRWLLIYLMGASPSFDATYLSEVTREVKEVQRCCPECCDSKENYGRFATSLRVSRFGYSNSMQRTFSVSFNSIDSHIRDLRRLLTTKSAEYERLGIFKDGLQVQLNSNVLQKESEFYSAIRFKQTLRPGETQLDALERRGVQYLEVRILDLNPFEKLGISLRQLHFLQVFMLFCLFEPSDPLSDLEGESINRNHHLLALLGRKPNLTIYPFRRPPISLHNWGFEILKKLKTVAGLMDGSKGGEEYRQAIDAAIEMIMNPSLLPSAQIQSEMKAHYEDHVGFGLRMAAVHARTRQTDIKEADLDGYDENDRTHPWAGAFHPIDDPGGAGQGSYRECSG